MRKGAEIRLHNREAKAEVQLVGDKEQGARRAEKEKNSLA
jgi:hypothetical protein